MATYTPTSKFKITPIGWALKNIIKEIMEFLFISLNAEESKYKESSNHIAQWENQERKSRTTKVTTILTISRTSKKIYLLDKTIDHQKYSHFLQCFASGWWNILIFRTALFFTLVIIYQNAIWGVSIFISNVFLALMLPILHCLLEKRQTVANLITYLFMGEILTQSKTNF